MRRFPLLLLLSLCLMPASAHAARLQVVASFSILGDMVHQVAGNDVQLTTLIAAGSDAHVYSPSPADAAALAKADLVIINGMGFEGWLERLIDSSGYKGRVLTASQGITPLRIHNHPDPHAWQDAANGKRYIINIRDGLSAADPEHANSYHERAGLMLARLDRMDRWIRKQISAIAPRSRKVITTHDAFGYYGKAYGITFIAPLGNNTENQAAAGEIARLVDQLRAQQVRAVFLENITDNRLIHQLEADTGAYIGGTLYSDALSLPDGRAPDYLALLAHNTSQLVKGMLHNHENNH